MCLVCGLYAYVCVCVYCVPGVVWVWCVMWTLYPTHCRVKHVPGLHTQFISTLAEKQKSVLPWPPSFLFVLGKVPPAVAGLRMARFLPHLPSAETEHVIYDQPMHSHSVMPITV